LKTQEVKNLYKEFKGTAMSKRWVSIEEGMFLRDAASNSGASFAYESGTCNGVSALWILSGLTSPALIHTFDPQDKRKLWGHRPEICFHNERFDEGLPKVTRPDGPVLFFVDGDHDEEEVVGDLNTVRTILRPKDTVVMHDILLSKNPKVNTSYL
jgi:predicted O-methyltransferase YrrM